MFVNSIKKNQIYLRAATWGRLLEAHWYYLKHEESDFNERTKDYFKKLEICIDNSTQFCCISRVISAILNTKF